MGQATLERRRRLPMRDCALCGQRKAVLQLTRVRGSWLCAACYREHVARARKPDPEAAAETDDAAVTQEVRGGRRPPDPTLLWSLHVVDAAFRYGGLAVRLVVYGVLYALARSTPIGPHLMAGFLLADGATWVVGALLDLRFNRMAVVAETLLFGVLFWLWLQTDWSFPEAPADRAILGLCALATLAGKTSAIAAKLTR